MIEEDQGSHVHVQEADSVPSYLGASAATAGDGIKEWRHLADDDAQVCRFGRAIQTEEVPGHSP